MNASCTERGFTLVELVLVLLLVGVLAAVAVPKLAGLAAFQSESWREQLVAGLRQGAAMAVGHRRLVCATVAADGVLTLELADANPATTCNRPLKGADGSLQTTGAAGVVVAVSPAGAIFFQPNGQVSRNGDGTAVEDRTINATGVAAVTVRGGSGHVE